MSFAPILRSAVTLVALVVTYQVYVLTIAPLVEPPAMTRSGSSISDAQRRGSYEAIDRYQALLAAYFPADHWSLVTAPKVIRVDELMFVLKEYQRHDNGSIDLEECAILVLPKDWQLGTPPPRETIVLEAPGGAHLQFDDDFQPARGKAGRIVKGEFPGQIVIRSDMKQPGPEDDLYISTRDLVMNETLIRTEAEVLARLGQSRGSGRKMVIRLSRDEHIKRGPSINGVQSLEIYEDVELELQAGNFDFLGDEPDKMATQPRTLSAALAKPQAADRLRLSNVHLTAAQVPATDREFNPPVEIKCQGRFHFDLIDYIASFDQNVEVRRMRLDGPFDQLDCNELSVHFAAIDEQGNPIDSRDDPDVARKQRAAVGGFKPIAIVATGNPVRAESAMQQASARAQRMRIHLLDRRLTLDGGREVMLAYGASEIHAPLIEYELPPADSPRSVGELSIAGPGWLRAVPDEERPDKVIDVAWKRAEGVDYPVSIRRRRGEPVLLLTGEPVIDAHRLGKVQADRLELILREVPADGPSGPALELTKSPTKLAVIPERLLAAGKVAFASPELTGRTHQLEATFEPWKPKGNIREAGARNGRQPGAGTPRLTGRERGNNDAPRSQYDLTASQIHLDLSLSGQRAEPTSATCEGSVVLREVRTRRTEDEPVVVKGDRLRALGLNDQAKFMVTGRADPSGIGGATIEARGLRLIAERIDADQKTGKFWINGPGRATMNIDGESFGGTEGESTPVTLAWQTGLDAAGQRIVVKGRVLAESQHGWIQADKAIAHLTRPVKVEQGTAEEKIEVAQVALEGNVVIDHRGVDEEGQTSHENLQLRSISLNRLTGDIQGTGPGTLRSVRLSDSSMSFADLAGAGQSPAAQPRTANSDAQLRFLRVDFAQGLTGNMEQRLLRFHRRVRSVYGPVDGWQEELPLHDPARLPPDTVTLGCETLVVNEDPLVARRRQIGSNTFGPVELKAIENVEIEGRSKKQGLFQAEAITASYSQQKDLFVLQGDGQRDAVLRHRDPKTGQFVETPAGTILYWASEPRVQLRDIHRPFDYQQE